MPKAYQKHLILFAALPLLHCAVFSPTSAIAPLHVAADPPLHAQYLVGMHPSDRALLFVERRSGQDPEVFAYWPKTRERRHVAYWLPKDGVWPPRSLLHEHIFSDGQGQLLLRQGFVPLLPAVPPEGAPEQSAYQRLKRLNKSQGQLGEISAAAVFLADRNGKVLAVELEYSGHPRVIMGYLLPGGRSPDCD